MPPQYHQSCDKCGSSDALSIFDDHTFCFACPTDVAWQPLGADTQEPLKTTKDNQRMTTKVHQGGAVRAIEDRRISQSTCAKYGVTVSLDSETGAIDKHHYPWYDSNGSLVGSKTRFCATKDFAVSGTSSGATLFGQRTCRGRGRFITITEGEIDCLSVSEMFSRKYDVVSVRNGASAAKKELQSSLEFLEGYDCVVLCFDNDKAGKEAVKECQDLFEPGKVKIVETKGKDANAMLVSGDSAGFLSNWWDAKEYTPAGIVRGKDTWDFIVSMRAVETVAYPWSGLNEMAIGIVTPSLVTITSGTGMGKTAIMRELQHYLLGATTDNLGIIPLEETVARASLGLMAIEANKPLHLDPNISNDDLRPYWEKTLGTDRVFLLDHFGSTSVDSIISRVRYLSKAHECRYVFLDHLSIVVSAQEGGDERKAIDAIMTRLRKVCEECNITLFLVSHLSRSQGTIHEEGGRVTLGHLRGSQAIAQLSDLVIAAERDQQHECPEVRNTTLVRVIKNRLTGETGPACYLKYNKATGRLTECPKPTTESSSDDQGEF